MSRVTLGWEWRISRSWTRVRMGDGIAFSVPWSFRKTRRKLRRAVKRNRLVEIPQPGRRVFLNARQFTYIEEL